MPGSVCDRVYSHCDVTSGHPLLDAQHEAMKWLPVCALIWPLSVAAEGFVEAVSVEQLPGLENTYPAWSPDGQFIVYASEQDGNLDIFRMRVDGSEKQYLTRHPATDVQRVTDLPDWDTYPAISPDGNQLLWRRVAPIGGKSKSGRNSEVFWMDLRTGATKGEDPGPSPRSLPTVAGSFAPGTSVRAWTSS